MLRATLAVTRFLFPLLLSATAMMGAHGAKEDATDGTPLPLLFHGRLVDDGGAPIPNAYVQFWQTDTSGVYDHPRFDVGFDAAGDSTDLDPSFQYFGTATTDANGTFFFRTYRPGIYAARPITHIHYKVWHGNGPELLLTSQFYFKDEELTFFSPLLQLDLSDVMDDDGGSTVVATRTNKTIVVNMGGGGSEPLTPWQVEGPYYPVVDFFGYDNDLTNATVNISITANDARSSTESVTTAVGVDGATREPGDGSGLTEPVQIRPSKSDTSTSSVSSTSAAATGAMTRKFDKMSGGGVGMVVSALSLMILLL